MLRQLTAILLLLCSACTTLSPSINGDNLQVDNTASTDSSTYYIIQPYKEKMDAYMKEVIGQLDVDMQRLKTEPETLLGNFASDLSLLYVNMSLDSLENDTRADMAILNFGGLRTSWAKGPISREMVFELMPFENNLVVVEMDSIDMIKMANYLAKAGGQPVSNMSLEIKDSAPNRIYVNNQALSNRTYRVVTSDYLANGGDNMDFFIGKDQTPFIKLRDAIMWYVEYKHDIHAQLEKRIYYAE